MSTNLDSRPARRSSFSIASLFYLIAILGVLLAIAVQAVSPPRAQPRQVAAEVAGMGILGTVLGGLIGLFHYRRRRGLSWGVLTGFVVGVCVGPVLSSQHYGEVVAACLGGSLLLVVLASIYRLNQRPLGRPLNLSVGGGEGDHPS